MYIVLYMPFLCYFCVCTLISGYYILHIIPYANDWECYCVHCRINYTQNEHRSHLNWWSGAIKMEHKQFDAFSHVRVCMSEHEQRFYFLLLMKRCLGGRWLQQPTTNACNFFCCSISKQETYKLAVGLIEFDAFVVCAIIFVSPKLNSSCILL